MLVVALILFFQGKREESANRFVEQRLRDVDDAVSRQKWDEAISILEEASRVPHSSRGRDCARRINEVKESRSLAQEPRLLADAQRAVDEGECYRAVDMLRSRVATLHAPVQGQAENLIRQISTAALPASARRALEGLPDRELAAPPDFHKLALSQQIEMPALRAVFAANAARMLPAELSRRVELARHRDGGGQMAETALSARLEAILNDAAPTGHVTEEYDRVKDTTTLEGNLGAIHEEPNGTLILLITQVFEGKSRTKPRGTVNLKFVSHSELGFMYSPSHDVSLTLDDVSFRDTAIRESDVSDGFKIELMSVDIPRTQSKVFAKVKSVEGGLGSTEFRLTPNQIKVIREFARYVDNPTLDVKSAASRHLLPSAKEVGIGGLFGSFSSISRL